jgi:DNA-binding PadR family transcriptional regulator
MVMSSNDSQIGNGTGGPDAVDISQLRGELDGGTASDEATLSAIASTADRSVFPDGFSFREERVKASLDELLVMLAGVRSSETHGKQLIDDLDEQFDTPLSPGTVYPRLHDLCDDGVLERRELVRTKEYEVTDSVEARATIAESARQHLALGLAFKAALDQGAFGDDE